MSSLALVYVDVTKHIVSSALVQSAYSTPPKLEDLVGTGPRIRDPDSGAPAINVASANVSLKILVLDTSTFNDRAMLDGLLGDPFNFYLAPKNAHDLTSPLVPTLAQPDGVTAAPVAGAGNTVAPSADASGTLQLLVLVQRGPIESSPICPPATTVGPKKTDAGPIQVTLISHDKVWILVETFRPLLKTVA